MSEQRLQEIQDRLDAATPGPWVYENGTELHGPGADDLHYVTDQFGALDDDPPMTTFHNREDAELVAHAPEDLSWLVQEHHRLTARIAYIEGWKQNAESRLESTQEST